MSRTHWFIAIGVAIASGAISAQNSSRPVDGTPGDFKVTLLGTGSPNPLPDRFGPSILVQAGPERLVFDCGRSCTTRLWQVGVPLGTVMPEPERRPPCVFTRPRCRLSVQPAKPPAPGFRRRAQPAW